MKNRFMKTLRLYLRTSLTTSPIIILAAIGFMVAMPIAMAVAPAHIGDKDYSSMVGCSGLGHIGVLMLVTMGTISNSRSKFLYSTADAKRLMTVVPVIVTATLGILYDTAIVIMGLIFFEKQTVADVMLIDVLTTVCFTFAISANCKKGIDFLSIIGIMGIFGDSLVIGGIGALDKGFGLSIGQAAAISAVIFAVGISGVLLILNVWWKKSDRIHRHTNNAGIAVPEMFGG